MVVKAYEAILCQVIATRRCPGVLCHNCHKAVEKDCQYLKDNGLSYVLFYKKQDQN